MRRFHSSRNAQPESPIGLQVFLWLLAGTGLGLAVAKWGNPSILAFLVEPPENLAKWIFFPWPLRWGYLWSWITGGLALVLWLHRRRTSSATLLHGSRTHTAQTSSETKPSRTGFVLFDRLFSFFSLSRVLVILPFCWLGWVLLSALGARDSKLTGWVLPHLIAVSVWFGVGAWALNGIQDVRRARWFWWPILIGLAFALEYGLQQHFGGLERVREQVMSRPGWQNLPAEYIERLQKGRIFGTLFYPNTFAGVLLLLGPTLGWFLWEVGRFWHRWLGIIMAGLWGVTCLACFYWTQSKAGWLLSLGLIGLLILWMEVFRRWRWTLILGIGIVGLAAFAWRFAGYFQKGATSLGARWTYWTIAAEVAMEHPLFGIGPNGFQREYAHRRPPNAEPSRLVHNDYLQQACDSGFPAAVLYAALWWIPLWFRRPRSEEGPFPLLVWLGLLAYALHSFLEFHLYIPGIAWPAFALLGWFVTRPVE